MRSTGIRPKLLAAFVLLAWPAIGSAQITITINPGAGLSGNANALAAFNRAAAMWTDRLTTAPTVGAITVEIDADLTNLGNSGVIGQTGSAAFTRAYGEVRDKIAATAAGQPGKAILTSLPNAVQITSALTLPTGRTFDGTLTMTTANAKAIGYNPGAGADATITFNSQFNFDYDRTNGVSGTDFQTVAAHEIGHALGFVSAVDDIDATTAGQYPNITLNPLDLVRFNANGPKPTTAAAFATTARELRPGQEAVTSDTVNEYRMSTGEAKGDQRQASHWKDDQLLGPRIGIMDPTLGAGEVWDVSDADLRAFELIGYNLAPVPEPATVLGLAAAGWAVVVRVRRRAGRAA